MNLSHCKREIESATRLSTPGIKTHLHIILNFKHATTKARTSSITKSDLDVRELIILTTPVLSDLKTITDYN